MNETAIRRALGQFSPRDYVAAARANGRAHLAPPFRDQAAALFDALGGYGRAAPSIPADLAATLALATHVCQPEWFAAHQPQPRYLAYTNVAVLHWAIGATADLSLAEQLRRCRRGIAILLADLLDFERRSLAGAMPYQQANADPAILAARISQLEHLAATFGTPPEPAAAPDPPADWASYLVEPDRRSVLRHLTLFPQTDQHDEVLFIRTIHIMECCCWGILAGVGVALLAAQRHDLATGAHAIPATLPFARLLVPLFQMMKTMPPAHFAAFREATGDASAIQSRTYQLLQLATLGLDERKAPVMAAIPELADLADPSAGSPNLRDLAVRLAGVRSVEGLIFLAAVEQLDRALYAWRALHFGIARSYLPPDAGGTGGTRGAPYLQSHFTRKIIPKVRETGDVVPHQSGRDAPRAGSPA
jgi:tryptophan 2,3-dioxygenase